MGRVKGKKHVRHGPANSIKLHVEAETTFLLKANTPYVLALKRITKILEKFEAKRSSNRHLSGDYKKVKFLTVRSMGRAIEKAMSVGIYFEHEKQYRVDYLTGTVQVLDEFKNEDGEPGSKSGDEEEGEDDEVMRKRKVSSVELRVWLQLKDGVTALATE